MSFRANHEPHILPEPEAELKRWSRQLQAKIQARIQQQGPIGFADFMEMALYQPGLGYYSAGLTKLGAGGDFITAPELGSVFAHSLAVTIQACAEALTRYDILEIGAGSGALAAGLLRELSNTPPRRYWILERSGDLRDRQQQRLQSEVPELAGRVRWIDRPPSDFHGVILANEVIDALPAERFRLSPAGIEQQRVAAPADQLQLIWSPAEPSLQQIVEGVLASLPQPLAAGYESELHPQLGSWLADFADGLAHGLLLLADYGYPRAAYYHPDRQHGTLRCHYRHRVHDDPLFWPGLQDITASVDFTAVAQAGVAHGLELSGYATQAAFILETAADYMEDRLAALKETERYALARQIRQLTLPGAMGERFQIIAFNRNLDIDLPGFLDDRRHRL